MAPMSVKMTLSKVYGGAPIQISLKEEDALTITYTANKFVRYMGAWVCSEADCQEVWPHLYSRSREWSLRGVKSSPVISLSSVNILKHAFVHDGRLANIRISATQAMTNPMAARQEWVNYAWNGTLPTVEVLKRLYTDQHPGEESPDPATSASKMQYMGGLMALVGAVWMFKRRVRSA